MSFGPLNTSWGSAVRGSFHTSKPKVWLEDFGRLGVVIFTSNLVIFGWGLPSPKLTACPWKSMVGRWDFLFEALPILKGLVSGSVFLLTSTSWWNSKFAIGNISNFDYFHTCESEWTDWYDDEHCDATKNADDSFAPKNSPPDKNKMPTTFDEAENHGTSSVLLLHKTKVVSENCSKFFVVWRKLNYFQHLVEM